MNHAGEAAAEQGGFDEEMAGLTSKPIEVMNRPAVAHPDQTALIDQPQSVTYRQS